MFWANFFAAVGFWSIALGGGLYWGRRYVRALEPRGQADARIAALESRPRINQGARCRGKDPRGM